MNVISKVILHGGKHFIIQML